MAGRVTTAIRFSPDLHQQIEQAANDQGISMNELVVQACEFALPHMRRPEDRTLFIDPSDR